MTTKSFLFAANDGRSEFLARAIERLGHNVHRIEFDNIDALTKCAAAALSLSYPKMEWWQNYQTHPLIQRRRALMFAEAAKPLLQSTDGVVTWGSWFRPNLTRSNGTRIPYAYYIDQSRANTPEPGEQAGPFRRQRAGNRLQRVGYEAADAIHCMSHWAVRQTLKAHPGLNPSLVKWAGWGPCAFDDSMAPDVRSSEDSRYILHVGNDFHRKGVDWFVEVARAVRSRNPEIRFVLAGKDQSGMSVDFGSDVEYLGPISDKSKLLELFRRASVFLMPNRFDRSPHVLVEAMSTGLPLVVSEQGGAPELVQDGLTGISVPVGDITGYANAVESIVGSEARRREMGGNGKLLVRSLYNWESIARRIVDDLGSTF